MRRREFITLLGGAAAAWPLKAKAQQPAGMRVVGWLAGSTQAVNEAAMPAFRQALNAHGFAEGRNLTLSYRYADGRLERLPGLAADLLRQSVVVAVVSQATVLGPRAIHAIDPTIPIVTYGGVDPVRAGVVASLNRPGGNITGMFLADVGSKRLGLMHEMLPQARTFAVLINSATDNIAGPAEAKEIEAAAQALGLRINVLNASDEQELLAAFERLAVMRADALLIAPNPFLGSSARQIAALSARLSLPSLHATREYPAAGGLMSYGTVVSDAYRIVGDYVGRILKGTKAGDLPVQRPTKFQLVINLKTARALGLTVSPTLLAIADEVIE
jgi:putative tryptophan/tyrosine transport system substrate-binding protein